MKEIIDSKNKYLNLKNRREEVLIILKQSEEKNRILKGSSGEGINV